MSSYGYDVEGGRALICRNPVMQVPTSAGMLTVFRSPLRESPTMPTTYLLLIVILGLGFAAQSWVRSAYKRASVDDIDSGMTGAQVARRILDAHGLHAVPVEAVPGELSDHYDPKSRTVRLSEGIHGRSTPAAVAVAAHEVGHAVQHEEAMAFFRLRSAIAPLAITAQWVWFVPLMLGVVLGSIGLVWVAIALYLAVIAFHVVTLPVEIDASRRAGRYLEQYAVATPAEMPQTRKVLSAAASTYIVAAVSSVVMLLAYVLPMLGARE